MKTKTLFLTTLIFAFLLICPTVTHAQTAKPSLDQLKLNQQLLGTWEWTISKDTVEVWEAKQYGKSFITNVSLVIKGTKSPYYINNVCFDSKEGKFKGFIIAVNGDYTTWIGLWTTEKKFSLDVVQDFRTGTVIRKNDLLFESPANMIVSRFNPDGVKIHDHKFIKVK